MRFRYRFLRVAAVTVAASLALAACSSTSDAPASSDGAKTIKIGFIDSLTGAYSVTGVEQQLSIRLAAKRINAAKSGVKVELVEKDDQSTPAGAVAAMQSILSDTGIVGVIGFAQTELAAATLPLLKADGRPAIFLQVTALDGRGDNIFSMAPPTGPVSSKVAEYVYQQDKAKTAAIIYNIQPTFSAANDAFVASAKKLGVKVTSDQGVPLTTTTYASQITNALSGNPDVIGVSTLPQAAGSIFNALRSAGFTGTIFSQQSGINGAAKQSAGSAADGVLVGSYWDAAVASDSKLSKEYLDAWVAAHPDLPVPDVFGLEGYDALGILQSAVTSAGTDKAKIAKALSSETFAGALQDQLTFSSSGFAGLKGYIIKLNATGGNSLVG